jgi:hypothetical protein
VSTASKDEAQSILDAADRAKAVSTVPTATKDAAAATAASIDDALAELRASLAQAVQPEARQEVSPATEREDVSPSVATAQARETAREAARPDRSQSPREKISFDELAGTRERARTKAVPPGAAPRKEKLP